MMVVTILFKINQTQNSRIIQSAILKLCSFDFFRTEDMYNKVFDFKESEPFNSKFESVGIESSNFILGIGPVFLSMVAFPCYVFVHKILQFFLKGKF